MVKNELRSELINIERELRSMIPFQNNEQRKRFHSMEKDAKILQGRIARIEKRERGERNRMLQGFFTNQLN